MNIKIYVIIFVSVLIVLVVSAVIGNILESAGTIKTLGPKGITILKIFYFSMFCILSLSLIPLVLKYFISMQIKIGNEEFFLIQWLHLHEQGVVYGIWALCILGLLMAFPAMMKAGFFK